MKTSLRTGARRQQTASLSFWRHAVQQWPVALTMMVLLAASFIFNWWLAAAAQTTLNITTIAGSSGGVGPFAEFQNARGLAVVSPTLVYIADTDNHVVRRINLSGGTAVITVFAGKVGQAATNALAANGDGGAAAEALLNTPSDVALDAAGNVYISDSGNHRVRRVNASDGKINTVVGNGTPGSAEGDALGGTLNDPRGLAFNAAGRLFIADAGSHRVAAVNNVGVAGATLVTIAGNGTAGSNGDEAGANIAALNTPNDVAVDDALLYIADTGNHKVRVIDAANVIHTYAGLGLAGVNTEAGVPISIQLNSPAGVAVDASHRVYISDTGNHRVRRGDQNVLETIAGRPGQGYSGDGLPATSFTLNSPQGLGVGGNAVIFMDTGNRRLRQILNATLSTLVSDGSSGFAGDGGLAVQAKLDSPAGIALDAQGNYYIADTNNHVIRKVNASDKKISTIAGVPATPSANPADPNGDGGAAIAATLNKPGAVAVDATGNIYIADTGNNRVRKVNASDGTIITLAGTVGAGAPTLNAPTGVAVAGNNVYIADSGNHVIRRVASTGGGVSIFAGSLGLLGHTGDGGSATAARLNRPSGVTVQGDDLLIADTNNHRVRRVSGGIITTIVTQGLPRSGFDGDGGSAAAARLNAPSAVAVDSNGNLYIVDKGNNRIRRVNVSDNKINTVIGNGEIGFSGDGGPAALAMLGLANGVAVGSEGVFVADTGNNRIRLAQAPPNSTPTLTNPGNKVVAEGQTLSFTLQATDPNGDQTLSYAMTNAPAGASLDATTGVFSYTPDFSAVPNNANATQAFNVTFTATDNAAAPLSDSETITITVNNVNRAPELTAAALPATVEATGANGASLPVSGTATDPDNDSLAFIWTDTRPGQAPVTIANQLNANVTLALGQHSLVLTVSDGKPNGTTSSAPQVVTVQDTTAPVLTNIPTDITQTITSGNGANVSFNLPTALDVVSGNRQVTATPASGSLFPVGMTTVTFTTSDAAGNPATATFKVTIVCSGCNPAPTSTNFNIEAFAGNGSYGAGDGASPLNASFKQPRGMAIDASGIGYIADAEARVIRKVGPGAIILLAGTGAKGFFGDSGAATAARFNNPTGLALDAPRNALYVADTDNHRIRKIELSGGQTITTVAGNGTAALGAPGSALNTALNQPMGVAVDDTGNLYIADTGNNRVVKVSGGQLTIIAGTGEVGSSGDGGAASAAKLNHPTGVAVSGDGATVYIADRGNHRVRRVSGGNITNFAGNGTAGFNGDGNAATSAQLNAPVAIALDTAGNLIIADTDNERLRKVTLSDGTITTIAGSGSAGNTGDGATATSATLDTPTAVAVNPATEVIVFADTGNLRARRLVASAPQNNAPAPAPVANQSLNKDQMLDVALSATDGDGDPVTFSLVPALGFASIINANPQARTAVLRVNPAGGNTGVYNVQVKAEDNKGGANLTAQFVITVNDPSGPPSNRPPVAVVNALPASIVVAEGATATVQLDGSGSSDPDGDPLTYSWRDNGQVIATTATATVSLSVGQHSIVLTVSDGRGGSAATLAQSVNVATAPPPPPPASDLTIETITPNSGKRGQTVTVVITGTGFTPQSTVAVSGGAVTVMVKSVNAEGTQLTATFAIANAAQTTGRNITVSNPGGASITKPGVFSIK